MRHLVRLLFILAGSLVLPVLAGCSVDSGSFSAPSRGSSNSGSESSTHREVSGAPARDAESIRIASFNIQVFGASKLGKPDVMDILAETARQFDVMAIQEIRSVEQNVMPEFVELINAGGARYDYVIGPRLGRTSSKEQYAYVFDTSRIELVPDSVYTPDDPLDLLHRPPLVARFRVRTGSEETPFSFTLVNIHTDPDETDTELDALDDVFRAVQQNGSGEDDVILLGDLNVDEQHLGELGGLPGIRWVIAGTPTNTRRTKSYDNLLFDTRATVEFTGYAGVYDLQREHGLTLDAALDVSDHLPVWSEFSSVEVMSGPLAARPGAESPQ